MRFVLIFFFVTGEELGQWIGRQSVTWAFDIVRRSDVLVRCSDIILPSRFVWAGLTQRTAIPELLKRRVRYRLLMTEIRR